MRQLVEMFKQDQDRAPVRRSSQSRASHKPRQTKEATYQRIITLLRETFPSEGFSMRDAVAVVREKLDLRHKTTQNAMSWARAKGVILRKGRGYYFTDFIQQQVKTRLGSERSGTGLSTLPLTPESP